MKPPQFVLESIERLAMISPCSKSKRAAIVYDAEGETLWGFGYNTPPLGMYCDGSPACRKSCGQTCIHAEQMALRSAIYNLAAESGRADILDRERPLPSGVWVGARSSLFGLTMLHVKVVDGDVVPGGPPSCWQCSREILEHRLAGFWLFEITSTNALRCDYAGCDDHVTHAEHFHERIRAFCDHHTPWSGHSERCPEPCAELCGTGSEWRYYTAEEFHRATLVNCGLHVGDLPVANHVLWGGRALCDAGHLRGVPGSWPSGQTWISLADISTKEVNDLVTCRTCRLAAPGRINGLKLIGAMK